MYEGYWQKPKMVGKGESGRLAQVLNSAKVCAIRAGSRQGRSRGRDLKGFLESLSVEIFSTELMEGAWL